MAMSDPILANLTDAQREAVTHVHGPMLVVAGAGSGKTRVVTRRIAYLIAQGVRPGQILAMTFTNKAAGEMKARVAALAGQAPRWVGTFHSMCARFLRSDLEKLGEGRDGRFSIYDESDQEGLVKQIVRKRDLDDKKFKPRGILSRISRAKCDMTGPDEFHDGNWDSDVIRTVYRDYERRLRETNALDFDDLLVLTVRILQDIPGLKEVYHDRFPFLLIDEYQDTNRAQYQIMRLLTGEAQNVHVTGDPDQSIYSWRGADYRNILDFQKDFPAARLVRLEQNYRSTQTILAAANAVIRNNEDRIEKDLFTEKSAGEKLVLAELLDEATEAAWVADQVIRLHAAGRPLRAMAVFYRTNAQSRAFEEALMRAGVPYQVVGGVRFYQRKEIKDLLAHLKLLVNPNDAVSLQRVTECRPTGVGAKTLEILQTQSASADAPVFALLQRPDALQAFPGRTTAKLRDFAAWCQRLGAVPWAPVSTCVEQVLKLSGLVDHLGSKAHKDPAAEDRIENLNALLNRALEFENDHPESDLRAFLEDVALVADIDTWDPEADQLTLMTLHAAKGLEFPVVFLVGLEEELLPHKNAWKASMQEEERRLFYVGLTRAEEQVFLAHATWRYLAGQTSVSPPSRFLAEIPAELLCIEKQADAAASRYRKVVRDWEDLDDDFSLDDADGFDADAADAAWEDEASAPDPGPAREAARPFRAGDHVVHATFGKGKVLSVSPQKAVVQFFAGSTRLLPLDTAELHKA